MKEEVGEDLNQPTEIKRIQFFLKKISYRDTLVLINGNLMHFRFQNNETSLDVQQ